MIRSILFVLLFLPIFVSAQKPINLKSKFFGNYEGNISSFQMDSGNDLIKVDSTAIQVEISEKTVSIVVGKNKLVGTYHVLFEAKHYFLLDCRMENQLAGERIVVYKKGKKISRDGLYPQPSSFLYKK